MLVVCGDECGPTVCGAARAKVAKHTCHVAVARKATKIVKRHKCTDMHQKIGRTKINMAQIAQQRWVIALVCVVVIAQAVGSLCKAPNFIVFLLDDTGFGDVRCGVKKEYTGAVCCTQ